MRPTPVKRPEQTKKAVPWRPQSGPQEKAIRASFVYELLYGGGRGSGKGLPPTAGVLTPWGFRPIGELKVGSRICSTDGQTQEIIGYYPRGEQQAYRLTWSDGNETICDADHIWLGWWSNIVGKRGGALTTGCASARKWTAEQIYQRSKTLKKDTRFAISPMSHPAVFNVHGELHGRTSHVGRVIPPYILGVLLGDGCLRSQVNFTSGDEEVPNRVRGELPPEIGMSVYKSSGNSKAYRIFGYKEELEALGVWGKLAHEKSIPRIYQMASVDERWDLLQGLMDTDGWSEESGNAFFCTVSHQLSEDVKFVARSLGAICSSTTKTPYYTNGTERCKGKLAYTVRIKIPDGSRLFTISRKRDRCAGKEYQSMALWLEKIVPIGKQETICISVSHPNSLYVTDGFVVTHNSDFLLGDFGADVSTYGEHWRGILFRRTYPELDELIERSKQIYYAAFPGAVYRVGSRTWMFPSGAQLRLRHLESDSDADRYQGHQYCVAKGTPVWMADGSRKPIENVVVGDHVMTLEGPRRVTATMTPTVKPCVALMNGGTVIQRHPVDHPILSYDGWISASVYKGPVFVRAFTRWRPPTGSEPMKYPHPYSGEIRRALYMTSLPRRRFVPCGNRTVYDITVEEVNHYITSEDGIINRNSWIGLDEVTQWPTLKAYHKLKACLRVGSESIPHKRIRCTGNPGGPGHNAVKSYFVDVSPESTLFADPDTGDTRMYIRGLVQDNHILMRNDPTYVNRLRGVGDEALVKAWLNGDWDVFVGQYFANWRHDEISEESFDIPESWPLLGGMDYGEAAPTSFGLYTVDFDGVIHRICEYYVKNRSATQHAKAILSMIQSCPFTGGRLPSTIWVDPSMFTRRRLQDNVQSSAADVFQDHGLYLTAANNDRVNGWRLINDALIKGKLRAFKGWNTSFFKTIPALPRDPKNPEDVDSESEDHQGDELRYLMAHAYKPAKAAPAPNMDRRLGKNVLKSLTPSTGTRRKKAV